jgi:hypothetical protein
MRKGLVTLGVVALVLAVSPGFAEAPLLSCLPDLVVSDLEENTQTDDTNLFIFQDAIDLDEYVEDADTADDQLRWSFIETSAPGGTIEINGIGSNPAATQPDDLLEPGAFNIRSTTSLITVVNAAWYGIDPGADGETTEATIEMYVSDGDTPLPSLRWSGIDPAGMVEINGILLNNPGVDTTEPGAEDLRAADDMMSLRNAAWFGTDPGAGAVTETLVEIYVSDGTSVTQQTMKVTTVNATNDTGQGDAITPVELASYDFAADEQGWTFAGAPSGSTIISSAGNAHVPGALTLTEPTAHTTIIFGSYESPKDPTNAVTPKLGCIIRARYQLSSDQTNPTATPGIRLNGSTNHVIESTPGVWDPNFGNQDFTSLDQVQVQTQDFFMTGGEFDGRVPGTGQEYTLLVFPRQVEETLLSDNPVEPVVTFVTCDLLDLEGTVGSDSGTMSIESVVIDGVDRPSLGAGTAVAGLTMSDFSTGWITGIKEIPGGTGIDQAGLTVTTGADLSIAVQPGNEWFEAFAEMATGVTLVPGQYYRVAFSCTTTATPAGDQSPTVQTIVQSESFVYGALKELKGGSLFSRLTATASLMELWFVAPSEKTSTPGLTEGMKANFKSYLETNSVPQFPSGRFVSATVACTEIQAEAFVMTPMGLAPAP